VPEAKAPENQVFWGLLRLLASEDETVVMNMRSPTHKMTALQVGDGQR
jgi:hypothetical protein